MLGLFGEYTVETFSGSFRLVEMQLADAETEAGVGAAGVRFGGFFEEFRRFLPASQLFQTNGHVEIGGRVPGIQAENFGVALGGVLILLEVVLELSLGRIDFQALFARGERAVDLIQRFLQIAFQVEGNRFG